MIRNIEVYQRIIRARTRLVLDHPFFGHLALSMNLVEDHNCDTAWSDGITLGYNPLYVDMLPHEKLKGLLGHVVTHPACGHHIRRNGRDARLWNMACDYSINWILVEAGLDLPQGYLDDEKLRNKTAEEIYSGLLEGGSRQNGANNPVQKKAEPQGDDFDAQDLRATGSKPGGPSEDREKQDIASGQDPEQNSHEDARQPGKDPGGAGEVRDLDAEQNAGSPDPDQGKNHEEQWKISLARAASAARSMGDLPGELARMIQEILSPVLDWREILSRFILDSVRQDYSWTPPNRRFVHQGIYLPSMRSHDPREMVVAVDTSGSISGPELDRFSAELSAILDVCTMGAHLIYCDARVNGSSFVRREDFPLKIAFTGGGGTDFRPVFDWVEKHVPQPMCLVYLTDLACSRFPVQPAYPVLWACTGRLDSRPPFGRVLSIN